MLKHADDNIINMIKDGQFDVVIHGCNCRNVMGSGIAKQFKDIWPGIFTADKKASELWQIPEAKLGNFSTYITTIKNKPLVFINAYTQLNFGRNKDYFEYESFYLILKKIVALFSTQNFNYGLPYIGMGNAGGDPKRIIPMIETFANHVNGTVTLVEYKNND